MACLVSLFVNGTRTSSHNSRMTKFTTQRYVQESDMYIAGLSPYKSDLYSLLHEFLNHPSVLPSSCVYPGCLISTGFYSERTSRLAPLIGLISSNVLQVSLASSLLTSSSALTNTPVWLCRAIPHHAHDPVVNLPSKNPSQIDRCLQILKRPKPRLAVLDCHRIAWIL